MISTINFISILIVAFIGSDRVNLLTVNFDSFILTPFIFLSIIFIILSLIFRINKFNFDWIFYDDIIIKILSLYLITIIFSVFFSMDIYLSIKRLTLLLFLIISNLLLLSFYNRKELSIIVLKGSIIGSISIILFNILLIYTWFYSIDIYSLFINLDPDSIAYFVPRLGGYTMDVNRGAIVLLFFTYFIFYNMENSFIKKLLIFINIIFLFLSFSRTLYFMLFSLFFFKIFSAPRSERSVLIKYFFSTTLFTIFILFYLNSNNLINVELLIKERFDIFTISRFTSSGIHLKLILDGITEAFNSIKILIVGSGIGTSYQLIEGYYWSGSKYGNYHSMYITSLVESGLLNSLSLFIFTFLLPLFKSYKNFFLDFIIFLFLFNIFYQLNMEPVFWFAMLLFYKINYLIINNDS